MNKLLEEKRKEFYGNGLTHTNPNCGNARFCNSHGGSRDQTVTYKWDEVWQFIESVAREAQLEVLERVRLPGLALPYEAGRGYSIARNDLDDKIDQLKKEIQDEK